MKKLLGISIVTFLFSGLILAKNGVVAPVANFDVHTIVTLGRTIFEGEKIRAVLIYGETGRPHIFLEGIKIEMGYPQLSKVLWREKIDVTAGLGEICPSAEFWCGMIENMQWRDRGLQYEIRTDDLVYRCTVSSIDSKVPEPLCKKK